MWNDEERMQMWSDKMDKGEMWIGGELVNRNEASEEEIVKLRESYQQKSEKWGYGGRKINVEQKVYENNRRKELKRMRDQKEWAKRNRKK